MKLCPFLVFGGSSPVQACLRHSIMVCSRTASLWLDICMLVTNGVTNRFASSVVAHNKRQGFVKLHHHLVVRAERPDPLDQHLQGSMDPLGFSASAMLLLVNVLDQTLSIMHIVLRCLHGEVSAVIRQVGPCLHSQVRGHPVRWVNERCPQVTMTLSGQHRGSASS